MKFKIWFWDKVSSFFEIPYMWSVRIWNNHSNEAVECIDENGTISWDEPAKRKNSHYIHKVLDEDDGEY